ncbi:MAG: DUF63 family protein [Candidatus Micrarchaeota archaeon]
MESKDFISTYFLDPIQMQSGYNIVNTLTYAVIAIAAVFLIYKLLKKLDILVDKNFALGLLPFILFGTTVRAITDSINNGIIDNYLSGSFGFIYSIVKSSGIYNYGFLTVSPGIYIISAMLFIASLLITYKIRKPHLLPYFGYALWLPNFIILAGMFRNFNYAILAFTLVLPIVAISYYAIKKYKITKWALLPIFSQAFDGGITYVMTDIYAKTTGNIYTPLSIVAKPLEIFSGSNLGFFVIKVVFAIIMSYLIVNDNEMKEDEKNYLFLVVGIAGLAPALHDLFQLLIAM